MRKVSKNRTDDEVVSSTNGSGSLANDDQRETDQSGEVNDNKTIKDNDSLYEDDFDHKTSRSRSKSRKSIADTSKKSDIVDNEDTNGDEEFELSTQTKSETPKTKAKGRPKKKKSVKASKNEEDEKEYEVEGIIASKRIKGKLHYLIRWKGFDPDSDTWEPYDTLSCPDIVNKYNEEKENPLKKGKRKSNKKESKVPAKRPKTTWDKEDENAEYEVDRILEVHHKKNGDRVFLIHWKGWSNKFDSWEPEKNLNCPELIKKFMVKVKAAQMIEGRSLRVAPGTTNRFTLQAHSTGRRLSKRKGQKQRVRYDDAE